MKNLTKWTLGKLFKNTFPTHKELFITQIMYLAGFAIAALIFTYFVLNETIVATTKIPTYLGWISDKIFNADRGYYLLGAFVIVLIAYLILLYVDRKSKFKAKGLRITAILFNKLLSVFTVFMGLGLFLDIASYRVDFIDPFNSIELIFLGALASHSLVYIIKNFKF